MTAHLTVDQFADSPFYQEREAAILGLLDRGSLATPAAPDDPAAPVLELSNVIFLASVAGAYGIPLESESVRDRLRILYGYACPDRWPEISRHLSELYAHNYASYLQRVKTGFLLKRPWNPGDEPAAVPPPTPQENPAPAATPVPASRRLKRHSHSATRRN